MFNDEVLKILELPTIFFVKTSKNYELFSRKYIAIRIRFSVDVAIAPLPQ